MQAETAVPRASYDLQQAILRVLADGGRHHKLTILGRPYQAGDLERTWSTSFSPAERVAAARAFEQLKRSGLLEPTYSDIADPENWVCITKAGRAALESGALDELDQLLLGIDKRFLEIRAGAVIALASTHPDSWRQGAHSYRELIDQVLKTVASDDRLRQEPGFRRGRAEGDGFTRRQRIRYLMQRRGADSESSAQVIEEACNLLEAVDRKLQALSHSRDRHLHVDSRNAVALAEIALRMLLGADENF